STTGTGVGLENIKRRLLLMYETPNLLRVNRTDSEFTVTIIFPA
ncbi:MAG TPA: sensor histidine kinase, partial [Bacteroidales bacterium]|nr:sensor histidine kinase [Bacteroidales bacterium]